MKQYGFYVDSSRCSGCKTCQVSCKDNKDLDVGPKFRRVYEYGGGSWVKEGKAGTTTPLPTISLSPVTTVMNRFVCPVVRPGRCTNVKRTVWCWSMTASVSVAAIAKCAARMARRSLMRRPKSCANATAASTAWSRICVQSVWTPVRSGRWISVPLTSYGQNTAPGTRLRHCLPRHLPILTSLLSRTRRPNLRATRKGPL